MKILVDKLPDKQENCLFYKTESSRDDYSGALYVWQNCSIDGRFCDGESCDKLAAIQP